MADRGLGPERTALSRRRTAVPFLVVALLGARAALEVPLSGLPVAMVGCLGAVVVGRGSPGLLTAVVVVLAVAAALVPAG